VERSAEKSVLLAVSHDSPENILRDVDGPVAVLESRETVLLQVVEAFQVLDCRGKENAMPGYDSTYVPFVSPSFLGRRYSPGVVGPKIL
jgi:hypothetical protein